MEKLTYGLIGCGRIAPNHITAAHEQRGRAGGCRPVRPCPGARREGFFPLCPEEKRASVRLYEDYREMLRDGAPALVAIADGKRKACGRSAWTVWMRDATSSSKSPSPFPWTTPGRWCRMAKEKNVKLCVSHQNRFNKAVQKIRSAVEEGRFGRMLHGTAHILWSRGEDYCAQAPWRGTWGAGRRLPDESVHPQHRPAALDDGRRRSARSWPIRIG